MYFFSETILNNLLSLFCLNFMDSVKLYITALIYGTRCYSFYDANTLLFRHLLLNNSVTFLYCFLSPFKPAFAA